MQRDTNKASQIHITICHNKFRPWKWLKQWNWETSLSAEVYFAPNLYTITSYSLVQFFFFLHPIFWLVKGLKVNGHSSTPNECNLVLPHCLTFYCHQNMLSLQPIKSTSEGIRQTHRGLKLKADCMIYCLKAQNLFTEQCQWSTWNLAHSYEWYSQTGTEWKLVQQQSHPHLHVKEESKKGKM